jgi:hypothetical protein
MSKHLGVRLGLKLVSFPFHLGAKRGVVLDDPIMDKSQFARAIEMRVGIFPSDFAMGRPASVADPGGPPDRVFADGALEIIDTTNLLANGNDPLLQCGNPGGVISPVFQTSQPLQKDWHRFASADVSDNSAHRVKKLEGRDLGERKAPPEGALYN